MDSALLYFDGWLHGVHTEQRPEEAFALPDADPMPYRLVAVTSAEDADRLRLRGCPTLLVAGEAPFAEPDALVGPSCRGSRTSAGLHAAPTGEQVVAGLT